MAKLCIIYNFAQHYREPIYRLIEKTWHCKWFFGNNKTDIKGISKEIFNDVTYVDNKKIIGPVWYQTQIGNIIRQKDVTQFLILGDLFNISTWWLLFQKKFFFKKKKVFLWSHGWYGKEGIIKIWLKKIYFGMADHIFTYGEYAKSIAIAHGFDAKKISAIHNSLDHANQVRLRNTLTPSDIYMNHFKNDNPNIIFIGRLTYIKQLDLLLDAIEILKTKDIYFNVTFIGTGIMEETLKNICKKLDIESQVWFYGECYDDQTNAELIYNADVCVAPGNVGLTAMHTMVYGTPIITHNDFKWQMPEFEAVQDGVTGSFFVRNDKNSLADTLIKWMGTHPDREDVRNNCYRQIDSEWTPSFQLDILKKYINTMD